ncbi:MAG: zinc ribbon domain-containing protein [Armatimonadetes bacterium]|nr:zinc ribbon domain-containing protein [Armatimonadota bacterium]
MDIMGSARKAFGKAADGVSRGAEALRLESEIGDLSKRLDEDWAAAGRRAQVLLKLGRLEDPELRTLVSQAEALEEKILARQEMLRGLRQGQRVRRCPGCGASVVEMTEFCGGCGRKLPVCAKCLEPLSAEDTECPACKEPVTRA